MSDTVQLTDRLPEIIDSVWDDVVELLKQYFIEHNSSDSFPCLHNDLDHSGAVRELIDSAIPIYTAQLSELAYFHHDAAISALSYQYGVTNNDWPLGPFAAGLYCLIEQRLAELYDKDGEDLWESWTEELDTKEMRKLAIQRTAQQEILS